MVKEQKEMENFKGRCSEYLTKQSVYDLRAYGRYLNLSRPTDLRKKKIDIEETGVVLQISVDLEKLNNTQKRLLKDFLNSL